MLAIGGLLRYNQPSKSLRHSVLGRRQQSLHQVDIAVLGQVVPFHPLFCYIIWRVLKTDIYSEDVLQVLALESNKAACLIMVIHLIFSHL